MKAVVFGGVGKVSLQTVPEPELQKTSDAIIRVLHPARYAALICISFAERRRV
jgi:threonine dehydrogenase-like Zn-dependent dehydrogenase